MDAPKSECGRHRPLEASSAVFALLVMTRTRTELRAGTTLIPAIAAATAAPRASGTAVTAVTAVTAALLPAATAAS